MGQRPKRGAKPLVAHLLLASLLLIGLPLQGFALPGQLGRLDGSNAQQNTSLELFRAAKVGYPWINLSNGVSLPQASSGEAFAIQDTHFAADPVALASGDFDGDGYIDLLVGYGGTGGGFLMIHRGRPQLTYPNPDVSGEEAFGTDTGRYPFSVTGLDTRIKTVPDILVTGDFDGDGRDDIIYASRAEAQIYLQKGLPTGALGPAQAIALPGPPTVLSAGEFDRLDGVSDLAVGIAKPNHLVLLYQSSAGGVESSPVEITVPGEVVALEMEDLDDYYPYDLLIASDHELLVVRGQGTPLSEDLPSSALDRIPFPSPIIAVELGDFVWDRLHRMDIAVIAEPGVVSFLEYAREERGVHPSEMNPAEFASLWETRKSVLLTTAVTRQPAGRGLSLTKGRISTLPVHDLIVWSSDSSYIEVFFGDPSGWKIKEPSAHIPPESVLNTPMLFPVVDPAASLIPLHLNSDAQHDLLVLHRSGLLSFSVSSSIATMVVNDSSSASDADSSDGVCDSDLQAPGLQCTLHAAIEQANTNIGTDTIHFSVSTVDIGDGIPDATDPVVIDGSSISSDPTGSFTRVELTRSPDGGGGPWIRAGGSVIRGLVINGCLDSNQGNYVSGNAAISLNDNGGNIVEGNYLGTDRSGTHRHANFTGIEIHDSAENIVGGETFSKRNVISGNAGNGLEIIGGGSRSNSIIGNLIGTDQSGSLPLGNDGVAVIVAYTSSGEGEYSDRPANNTFENNVIAATLKLDPIYDPAGFTGIGVSVQADGTLFKSNKIGTALDGTTSLGNASFGFAISDGAGNSITENVIAFNGKDGIALVEWSDDDRYDVGYATISGNSIHSNGGLGINLMEGSFQDGVTPNDPGDTDTGPNTLVNFPVVSLNADRTTVEISYDGTPSTEFTFELFRNTSCDPSGYGEGETHLKHESWFGIDNPIKGTTDSGGHLQMEIAMAGAAEGVITATATDPLGNTSEFSKCDGEEGGLILSPQLVFGMSLCGSTAREIQVKDKATGKVVTADSNISFRWIKLDGSDLPKDLILDGLNELRKKYSKLVENFATIDIQVDRNANKGYVTFKSSGLNVLQAVRKNATGQIEEESNYALLIGGMELIQADGLKIEPLSLTSPAANVVSDFMTRRFGGKFGFDPPMLLFPPSQNQCSWVGTLGQYGAVRVASLKFRLLGDDVETVDLMDAFRALKWVPAANPLAWLARVISIGAPVAMSQLLNYQSALEATGQQDPFIEVKNEFSITAPPFLKGGVISKGPGITAVQATFDMSNYCLGKATDLMLVAVAPDLEQIDIRNEKGGLEDPLVLGVNEERKAETVGIFDFFAGRTSPFSIPFDPIGVTKQDEIRKFIESLIPGSQTVATAPGTVSSVVLPPGATTSNGVYLDGENYYEMRYTWDSKKAQVTISKFRLQTAFPDLVTEWKMEPVPNDIASVEKDKGILKGLKPGKTDVGAEVCIPFTSLTRRSDTNGVLVLKGGAIYVHKYEDLRADGIKDRNDPGLNGWSITLERVDNGQQQILDTGFFDLNSNGTIDGASEEGWAVFENLEPTLYRIFEKQKTGWTQTSVNPGVMSISQEQARIARFGNFKDITIEGVKYEDQDGNGSFDAGEPGLSGWTIEVDLNSDGSWEHTTVTGTGGAYRFDNVGLGDLTGDRTFTVREVAKPSWIQTAPLGNTPLPFFSGMKVKIDFGNFRVMSIRGTKFHDEDGDGVQGSGEVGLPDWEIHLDLNADGVTDAKATTDSAGGYAFNDVGPGDPLGSRRMSIKEIQQTGWRLTFPLTGHDYPIHSGLAVVADFGNTQTTEICGTKFDDLNGNGARDDGEPGLSGWTIEIVKPDGAISNGITDSDGRICFKELDPGSYTVREVAKPDWIQTYPGGAGTHQVKLESGQSFDNADFGNFHVAAICGAKFHDVDADGTRGPAEPGLPGWTIRLDGPDGSSLTVQTSTGGQYCFENLGPGSFALSEVQQHGWTQTTPASAAGHSVNTESGKKLEGLDFGNAEEGGEFIPVTLCGTKFNDLNGDGTWTSGEPGLADWTIELLAGSADVLQATRTNAQGQYCFGKIGSGTYNIREVQVEGWHQTFPSENEVHPVTVQSGKNLDDLNFGNFRMGSVSGWSFNDLDGNGKAGLLETGLSGWTIFVDLNRDGILNNPNVNGVCDKAATEPCAKTDTNGAYTISELGAGPYTLREVLQPGWKQTTPDPENVVIQEGGATVSGLDFGNSSADNESFLYFPFYQSGPGVFSAYALSNYSSKVANLRFTAYGTEGELQPFAENPMVMQLPAGQQVARLGPEIFNTSSSSLRVGWVEVSTDNPEVGSFFQFGTNDLQGLDGSVAITEPQENFHFTRIYEYPPNLQTYLAVANPNDSVIRAVLTLHELFSFGETTPEFQVVHEIPRKGLLLGSVSEFFNGFEGDGWVEVQIENAQTAVGFGLIEQATPKSIVGLNAIAEGGSTTSYSAQLASTYDVFTSIKLINTSDELQSVDMEAIGETGELVSEMPWLLFEQEQFEDFAAYVFEVDFENPLVGSLRVTAESNSVLGDVLFGDAEGSEYLAALPLQKEAFKKAVFSHVANGLGFFTGLAFYNPDPTSAEIRIEVRRATGELAGERSLSLSGGHRISKTLVQLVPESKGLVGGYILVESTSPIIAQQLFGRLDLSLMSAVPPTVID